MKTTQNNWIDVDLEGLREIVDKRYCLRELISNALDESINGATSCEINVTSEGISITDNAPKGFRDLSDSYTLFRYTPKREKPEVRGRFNSGEKTVLAHSNSAIVTSTTGTVEFREDGTKSYDKDNRTEEGSDLIFKMEVDEDLMKYWDETVKQIKVPKGFIVYYTSENIPRIAVEYQKPVKKTKGNLPTWYMEGDTRKTVSRRKAEIFVYDESPAYIYELGIPVEELEEDRFSYDIQQKVPLDQARDTIKPKYLKEVRGATMNVVQSLLDEDDLQDTWVIDSLSSKNIEQETFEEMIQRTYPDTVLKSKVPQANENAVLEGKTVLDSRQVPKAIRNKLEKDVGPSRMRDIDLLGSAIQFAPARTADKKYLTSRDQSQAMKDVAHIAKVLAKRTIGKRITVEFYTTHKSVTTAASFGNNGMEFNVTRLGVEWFNGSFDDILEIIIHELGHHVHADFSHLSASYVDEVAKIGAKVALLCLLEPEIFEGFT